MSAAGSAEVFARARRREHRVLALLALAAAVAVAAFCLVALRGNWEYALGIRVRKVAAMVVVGCAVAVSSVLFQTVTNNRVLTPGIMGFDSLFVLVQTLVVFAFGALALSSADPRLLFAGQVVVMVVFAGALYRWLFDRRSRDLYVLVLVGVICGTLFSSLSSLAARLINPNDFVVLQDSLFASFTSVDRRLLAVSAVLVAVVSLWAGRLFRRLDVLALGREHALNLGVDHRSVVNQALVAVAVLVSVATALVGPITFLGLLVANLARQLSGVARHRVVVPASALLSVVALVGGQLVLERVFGLDTALSVIINFVGGVYFIALLIREAKR
ncbi:iron chelate uptake ABC transporter family permease subunit [Saccharothrix algeriensis]|uniref:Iron chelate uptake ABC transporter family permease subunit n=1 Tax=Saccharothrix algeriensis TaxID=173560 RepID=A0A8T8HXQ5_9PSEU|nr:iron chelate uptake ABC transporter family permease subunit [Saccharothrix algeriensis]MBM7814923.1 iron complex transport system permease protein [Saccharothrix algeriensis]QTR03191.1 iron chelate uptake ABC transporter family permease subunit [Saccharothrix algeriensis]